MNIDGFCEGGCARRNWVQIKHFYALFSAEIVRSYIIILQKYRKVHFLFTAPCTPELSSMFRGQIIDPITVTKQEIIVDIYVGEKNVYHFGKPEHNQLFFFSPEKSAYLYERYCISAVEKLKSLFAT